MRGLLSRGVRRLSAATPLYAHKLSFYGKISLMIAGVILFNLPPLHFQPDKAKAAPPFACMYLFFEGTTPPAMDADGGTWTFVTTYNDRFIRGETVANAGLTGGSTTPSITAPTHNHAINGTASVAATTAEVASIGGSGTAATAHTHTGPSVSSDAASSLPSYRDLRMIKYNGPTGNPQKCIPNIIPAGSIALFDDNPGLPATGWTRLSDQDSKMIRIDSASVATNCVAPTTCGSDTHVHNLNWGTLGFAGTAVNRVCTIGCNVNASSAVHTHTIPTTSNSQSASTLPPYIQPILARANVDTTTLAVGITGIFDADPGGGWSLRSTSGQPYYQKFIRPGATYNATGGGAVGHVTPTSTVTSGVASASSGTANALAGAADANHTHVVSATFPAYTSDANYTANNDYFLPPYVNFVIAEKVNFILKYSRWFVDSGAASVTDPWSSLDIAQNTPITGLPTGNDPPDDGRVLRLRVQILVNGNNLPVGALQLSLEYKKGSDATCTTGGPWYPVAAQGDTQTGVDGHMWRYRTDDSLTNGTAITPLSTPLFSPVSNTGEAYVSATPSVSNPSAVTLGNTMEWDFGIQDNGATSATTYSFRVLEANGTLMSVYDPGSCATLSTKPGPGDQLRHGEYFDTEREQGFSWN